MYGYEGDDRKWTDLSRTEQIWRLVVEMVFLSVFAGGMFFELYRGAALYGYWWAGKHVAYVKTEPMFFVIVMILQLGLFSLMAYAALRDPLTKGWNHGA